MIMETNKKSYLKPTIELELYMYEDLSIMENSEPMIDDGGIGAKHNNGGFESDNFSDDDEDDLSYKEYTVNW